MARLNIDSLLDHALFWVELDEACVRAYMDASSFAPVVVFETDEGLKLADGYHRAEAARRAGRTTIDADVRGGSWREAMRYAAEVDRRPRGEPDEEMLRERARTRENIKHFRADIGLPTDDAVIDWLMTQWEIGLSTFETDEESERIAPHEAAVKAAQLSVRVYAEQHPESWAGTWQEYEHGAPFLCVAFTGDLAPHREALALPRVEIRVATRTMGELDAISASIDPDALQAVGAEVSSWGVDVHGNLVYVQAAGVDEAAARDLLHARYGDAVRLELGVRAMPGSADSHGP